MRTRVEILRWSLYGLVGVVVLAVAYVVLLAFPRPFFAHTARFREFTVYANRSISPDIEHVIDDARRRVAAMEHARPGVAHRVFLCERQRLYSLFAFLTRRSPNSLGIGLVALHTIYVNEAKVLRMIAAGASPRYSRFDGDPAAVIAHEIAHFNVIEALGMRAAWSLPTWKSEGYADYQANLAATRADGTYEIADRIALLQDRRFWAPGRAREHEVFEWQLLVEFLGEVEGLRLREIAAPEITEASARDRMLAWFEAQPRPAPAIPDAR